MPPIEAPPAPAQQQAAPSMDAAIAATQQKQFNQQPPAAPKQEPAKEAPKGQEKPKEAPPAKTDKPKSPWDKLDAVKTVEEGSNNKAGEGDSEHVEGEPDKAAKAREKFGEYKKSHFEYQEKQREWAEKEKRLAELESFHKEWTPRASQFDELNAFRASKAIEETPEFQEQIIKPWAEREAFLKQAAEAYNIDHDALTKAVFEPNVFKRGERIGRLLRSAIVESGEGDDSPEEIADRRATAKQQIEATAVEMHKLQSEADRHRAQAQERWSSIEGKKKAETEQQKAAREGEYKKAHDEVFENLSKRQLISNDFDFEQNGEKWSMSEAIKSAAPAEDPMGRAFQAQAGEAMPFLVNYINKLKAELAEAKKIGGDRLAAKPSLNGQQAARPGEAPPTLDAAIAATKSRMGV